MFEMKKMIELNEMYNKNNKWCEWNKINEMTSSLLAQTNRADQAGSAPTQNSMEQEAK